ncbi:hypothetical protein VBP81_002329 [Vibrio fluvialis]|uniref:hypothetical protein n=1 Tax=Vibrio cholerae TaxID=666 RepID=UPI001A1A6BF4|nr:hypothetical protein [Vibrio cholerae]EGQ7642239.1 hypothetical protein [Vibrio cholerae]ELI0377376.1 hypothetical protein [Vibrio cholerae]EMC0408321.1 hypothetical protein [Vibrio fluvialis]
MPIFLSPEFISAVITVSSILLIQVIVFFIYRQTRDKKYDEERRRIEMEKFRESLEKRIYDLTERMLAKEERWRDVNHLLFDSQASKRVMDDKVSVVRRNEFLDSAGLKESDYEVDPKLVFVITPFNDKYNEDFDAIATVCNDVGLKCVRGDEEYIKGDILGHILKQLVKSRVVIANINGRNPNVFYELGLSHALEKPTLITSKSISDIPFDLRTQQLVLYKNSTDFKNQLSKALLRLSLDTKA